MNRISNTDQQLKKAKPAALDRVKNGSRTTNLPRPSIIMVPIVTFKMNAPTTRTR